MKRILLLLGCAAAFCGCSHAQPETAKPAPTIAPGTSLATPAPNAIESAGASTTDVVASAAKAIPQDNYATRLPDALPTYAYSEQAPAGDFAGLPIQGFGAWQSANASRPEGLPMLFGSDSAEPVERPNATPPIVPMPSIKLRDADVDAAAVSPREPRELAAAPKSDTSKGPVASKEAAAKDAAKKTADSDKKSADSAKKTADSAMKPTETVKEALPKSALPTGDAVAANEMVGPIRTAGDTPPVRVITRTGPTNLPVRNQELNELVAEVSADLLKKYSRTHKPEHIAATVIDMGNVKNPIRPVFGSFHGDQIFYPASVVKVFYMGAAFVWARAGRLELTDRIKEDMAYMIGPSSNTATVRVLNKIAGTASGDALNAVEFKKFSDKREQVNTWLRAIGLEKTNANEGTWDGDPSPRDMQLMTKSLDGSGPKINHNKSTTNETARYLYLIATNQIGTKEDCDAMRKLMLRPTDRTGRNGYRKIFQDRLPDGVLIWGKSGYTSETSHDTAIITTPSGRRFILAVFADVSWDTTAFLGDFAVETMKRLEKIEPHDPKFEQAEVAGGA